MNIIGKKRGRKQKIQRSILQSVVFQWYKIQYFFTGTNYLRLKLFVIRTFILFLKIKMYACRTFWLSCFFIKDVDNAAYTVGKTFQRGKRPVLLWQSRLKKMSSASGYERVASWVLAFAASLSINGKKAGVGTSASVTMVRCYCGWQRS